MLLWKNLVEISKYQIYISRSLDPFLNLSIEHYLLQKSPPHSTVLFLYVNKPCVVIGRNQNPWLEVDLRSLRNPYAAKNSSSNERALEGSVENVQLVRRRSGGGTVFHDEGNVNYSVICPTADFTRDKHVEMVTNAIREFNTRARVNERHDIVLDQGPMLAEQDWPDSKDMHQTAFRPSSDENPPLKVSGSAYKLTRQRSLHHGTCLLASANIPHISQYLRSPARQFIKARGVESVRSPIGNIHADIQESHSEYARQFRIEVVRKFAEMYEIDKRAWTELPGQKEDLRSDGKGEWAAGWVGNDLGKIKEIDHGVEELKASTQFTRENAANTVGTQSPKWLYEQTPQFTLSSHPVEEDDRERPPLPKNFPSSVRAILSQVLMRYSEDVTLGSCIPESQVRPDNLQQDINLPR